MSADAGAVSAPEELASKALKRLKDMETIGYKWMIYLNDIPGSVPMNAKRTTSVIFCAWEAVSVLKPGQLHGAQSLLHNTPMEYRRGLAMMGVGARERKPPMYIRKGCPKDMLSEFLTNESLMPAALSK